MRTVLLCWSFPPARNGLASAAAEIAAALRDSGHDVTVIALDRTGRATRDGTLVIGCAPGPLLRRLRRFGAIGHLVPPFCFWRAVRACHAEAPVAVVEATNWYAPGLLVALLGPAPLVTRNSTPASITANGVRSWRDRLDHRAAMLLEAMSARRSAALISNTAAHGATIAARYRVPPPGPAHAVIGLSLPETILAAGRGAAYPPSGDGPLCILFVGRAEARKGFAELLDAAATLAAEAERGEGPEFRLHLVGIDALPRRSDALLSRMALSRDLPEPALHAMFAAAHLVAAPSRYESFGLVYQEAMAFGRPILACAEDASARRFVGETGAGLLAERCEGGAIALVLRRMLRDPALRDRLHRNSRAAAGMFTRATLAAETVALYRTAIEAGSNGRRSAHSSEGRPAPARMVS
ncbi:glycosyltransferase family 4 protein [Acetobacteraceae bacterium KSS8]|uniref:Glycosyltransferase family 4 protein n=1 Tax=Endosaccharibacter trunci TaxID=2812733 RepID=A0ABT1W9N1_9PROT|nr:glycosyltransferase family 4 protein [Acetobacteraceae bacterium KSS8]